jgi:signal transduction histidine kinase
MPASEPERGAVRLMLNKHAIMVGVVVTYATAFILTFDKLYDSIQISSIGLIGLFVWFYGMRAGFVSLLGFILLNTLILWQVSGKPEDILLTYNPLAILLCLVVIILTGSMKKSADRLIRLRNSLSQRVEEETRELANRVQQLVEYDEAERVRIGQDLHDGIGQLLTGMLLHSEALSEKLITLKRPEAEAAGLIRDDILNDIRLIRKLSRSLLPIHLNQYGLDAALEELTDYFTESTATPFELDIASSADRRLSHSTALHLYRIIQESVSCIVEKIRPEDIRIAIDFIHGECTLDIECNGPKAIPEKACMSKVLEYRVRAIQGTFSIEQTLSKGFRLSFCFPAPMEAALP